MDVICSLAAANTRATLAAIVDPAPAVQAYGESLAVPVFESIAELLSYVGSTELSWRRRTLCTPENVLECVARVVPDPEAAVAIVEAIGLADVGILADTLHFNRSCSGVERLDRIPAEHLPFVHVCDAPVQATYSTEELLHAGRAERLPPGEGASTSKPSSTTCPPAFRSRWRFR